ncbi:MAG: hypothetical protein R6U57_08705 [Anaerolineales bacterium]
MDELLELLSKEEREHVQETPMPEWMDPMRAQLTKDYFSDPGWIFERKLDGERVGFGALLLGYYDGDDLMYAGKVGTGFDEDTLQHLGDRLSSLERENKPFADGDISSDEVHWVEPQLVAQIEFEEWTDYDKLRQPRFQGLRQDKAPEDVVREEPPS